MPSKEMSGAGRAIFINSAGEHSSDSFCGKCAYASVEPESGKRVFPGIDADGIPVCAKFNLGTPQTWQGHCGVNFRNELLPLTLWKCKANYWLVVEGFTHNEEVGE
jgi:hypothetical protein